MSAKILTVEQAAELLSVRPKTVRALAAGGIIPAAKVGKFWRVDEVLLREWLRNKASENVQAPRAAQVPSSLGNIRVASPAGSLSARLDRILAEPPTHTERKQHARPGVRL
jgi:excisionase family DNA binding protein